MSIVTRGFLIISLLITACATSPTGRHQLMLTSDATMNEQGTLAFTQLKKETPIESDPAALRYVHCVADSITQAAASQLDIKNWEVVVFKSDEVNAFALPGGKIGVYTGIFKAAQNSAQLAAVLGHEVGHVIARHGAERYSQQMLSQGLLAGTGLAAQNNPKANYIMLGAYGVTQFGYLLPHSREQESEADLIGLNLMARAGFDPDQAVVLWHNMQNVAGSAPPEFLSTHPANSRRIHDLETHLNDAKLIYQQSQNKPQCVR